MPLCIAITQGGTQCIRNSREGDVRCGGHMKMYEALVKKHGRRANIIQRAFDQRMIYRAQLRGQRERVFENQQHEYQRWTQFEFPGDVDDDDDDVVEVEAIPLQRPLQALAEDNQNVHTTIVVNQTKEIVKRILAISIPHPYKWNIRIISKTPGEIITNCRLSINAGRIMMDKYTLSDDIYEMGEGIYGKVLDGVWQYIKASEHKEDLCKILAQELRDNVAQCLQGNLSRLCNVLAGYMEGVGSQESMAEILGRRFALISTRVEGILILDELGVMDEIIREEWLSAL